MKKYYFIISLFFFNCQTKQNFVSIKEKTIVRSPKKVSENIKKNDFEKQVNLKTLKNVKWIFENYSIPVENKNYKKPTIIFTEVNSNELKFSGESYVNIYLGKFKSNNKRNFFFERTSYKISTLYSVDKRLEYLEFRFVKDFKKINSIKVYNERLVLGIKNSTNTMIFLKTN